MLNDNVINSSSFFDNAYLVVCQQTQSFFRCTSEIKDNGTVFKDLWRFVPNALSLTSISSNPELITRAFKAALFLAPCMLFVDIADYLSGQFENAEWQVIAIRICFAVSNLALSVFFVSQIGVLALTASQSATLAAVGSAAMASGFYIAAHDAFNRFAGAADHQYKIEIETKALLDLFSSVAGAAIPIIALVGTTISAIGITALAITASGLSMLSFSYAFEHKEAFLADQKAKENDKPGIWRDCSMFVSNLETLKKLMKVVCNIFEATAYLELLAFADNARCFIEFQEVLSLFKRGKEWSCPDKDSEVPFWQNSKTTIWKVVSKIFLTGVALASMTTFLIKYELVELALIASTTIYGMPLLRVVSLTMMSGYTFFSLMDNAAALKGEYDEFAKKSIVKASEKLNQWEKLSVSSDPKSQENIMKSFVKSKVKTATGDVKKYVEIKLGKLKIRYNNAVVRCYKVGIGILFDFSRMMTATLGIALLATSIPALGFTVGTLSITAGILGLIKIIYDAKIKTRPELPKNLLPKETEQPKPV
jgi:endonuclease YncB( thermonuclease family)